MSALPKLDIFSKQYTENPQSFFKPYREHSSVHYLEDHDLWIITRYDDVKKALADPRFNRDRCHSKHASAQGAGYFEKNTSPLNDNEHHRRSRLLVSKAFFPKRVERMQRLIDEVVGSHTQNILKGGVVDLSKTVITPVPNKVISRIIGVPPDSEEQEQFLTSAMSVIVGMIDPDASDHALAKAKDSHRYLFNYLAEEINKRKKNPQDDMLSDFVDAAQSDPLCEDNDIIKLVLSLIAAGSETTVHSSNLAILNLYKNPQQLKLLRDDRSLMSNAVMELLRFDDTGKLFRKYLTEDAEYGGKIIKKGESVYIVTASANHDPSAFPNPDVLDITRCTKASMSFGFGPHYCVGVHLAKMEMVTLLNSILDNLPEQAAVLENQVRWDYDNSILRSITSLPVETGLPLAKRSSSQLSEEPVS
ncbi:MAG: hypothetical protein COB04_03940 [Gammaproteobacteria bacterium]|nr:MAG: hypothetical protein COB04_03940 [Gammaproteobacteria bacterium]